MPDPGSRNRGSRSTARGELSKKRKHHDRSIEDRYEEVRTLLSLGKDRGYLAYEEINEMLPDEVSSSPEEIEEIFTLFEAQGIELVDAETKEQLKRPENLPAAKKKDAKQEVTDGLLEKTNDPVRMYLREMGTVPLLTREGEVSIAAAYRTRRGAHPERARPQLVRHGRGPACRRADPQGSGLAEPVRRRRARERRGADSRDAAAARAQGDQRLEPLPAQDRGADKRSKRLKPGGKAYHATMWDIGRCPASTSPASSRTSTLRRRTPT